MTEQVDEITRLESQVGNKTDARLAALTEVRAHRVAYRPRSAEWSMSGEPVGSWEFRTLSGLRLAGALMVGEPDKDTGVSTVELTEAGEGLLLRWLD